MRLAVSVTSDVIGSATPFGPSATYDVMVDTTDRAGTEPM
jgi:hypothetical protein